MRAIVWYVEGDGVSVECNICEGNSVVCGR